MKCQCLHSVFSAEFCYVICCSSSGSVITAITGVHTLYILHNKSAMFTVSIGKYSGLFLYDLVDNASTSSDSVKL